MSDKVLLSVADKVNEIYHQFKKDKDTKLISAPRLVLVGAQSSGKSSLVNRIVGFDLTPIGDSMVTRTPVNIRMHYADTPNSATLALSMLIDGVITQIFKITIQAENKVQNLELFRKKISDCTDKVTKNKWSVSNIPLYIDIHSNKVQNFSFVDLPGQVAIAKTDEGQSERLIEEIEELIK